MHPPAQLLTVGPDERKKFKNKRLERGWDQKQLAKRIGVTPATISNFEGGRSKQVKKIVYAKIRRALFQAEPEMTVGEANDVLFSELVADLVDLNEQQQRAVSALIKNLKKTP